MKKQRVVIVGGGSAGWITAAYLNGALNNRGQDKNVEITLVESPDIPRISVGEATIPSIRHVLEVIGVNETEFMMATDASFKQSIKYVDWLNKDGSFYHHPFTRFSEGPIDRTGENWMKSQRNIPFMETVSVQPVISEMCLAPKMLGAQTIESGLKYAFHLDAQKFADYLRDFSITKGVSHILANVEKANVDENGMISNVLLEDGRELEADLYVDCTGFKALLIGEALGVPYDDYSQWLLCDQAVVAQFPNEEYFPGIVRPYTTATAMSSGWVWDTPTQTRRSVGYVHSSQFIEADKAKEELLKYQSPDLKDYDTRLIKFSVGQRRKAWAGNCIAIGLSGGFIEPLESTGLYLCELAAVMMAEHFPSRVEDYEDLAFRFNRVISNRYYEILDFINLHYCLTRRTDSEFWREVQKPERINDRLKAKLEHWKMKAPSRSDFEDQAFNGFTYMPVKDDSIDPRPPVDTAGLWNHESYECILYGMNFRSDEFTGVRPPAQVLPAIINRFHEVSKALAPHHVWLHHELGMPQWQVREIPKGWGKVNFG